MEYLFQDDRARSRVTATVTVTGHLFKQCHGHGHGHGVFILATSSTYPEGQLANHAVGPSFALHPSAWTRTFRRVRLKSFQAMIIVH
jgi:hypothetical protein